MSLHRVVCDCKCQTSDTPLGNCLEHTGCETVLKVNFSYPAYSATENFGGGKIFSKSATAFSGHVKIFTPPNCQTYSCSYQGVRTNDCLDEVKCIDPVEFVEPTPSAVSCWFGEKFENIGHDLIPVPQYPFVGDISGLDCDCWNQSASHGPDGWYWAEIKQGGYLRMPFKPPAQDVWCQDTCPNCGAGDPDPPHPEVSDILGGDCCDALGYRKLWYRGLVQRMSYSKLFFNATGNGSCDNHSYDPLLPQNRWIIKLGYTMNTSAVGRQRNCSGSWGTMYYTENPCGSGNAPCTTCRENDRSSSWDSLQFPNFYGGEHCISSWALPEGIVDCKDLVGISNTTAGVTLVKPYTPADGGASRWTGDYLIGFYPTFNSVVTAGFEANSWSIANV